MFRDRKMAPMEDLHEELARVAPGSKEEQAILGRARGRVGKANDEITATRAADMLAAAPDERQVVGRESAQHAAHVAIEHVTGEQQVPVHVMDPAAGSAHPEHRPHA